MEELHRLAELVMQRNLIDYQIARILKMPAIQPYVARYIAAAIFGIELPSLACSRGRFTQGELAGKSVEIRWRAHRMKPVRFSPQIPNFCLVLTGAKVPLKSLDSNTRPLVIDAVHLFRVDELIKEVSPPSLEWRFRQIVPAWLWEAAEVYPASRNPLLRLTEEQRELLELFSSAEFESELRWQAALERSQEMLARMAGEALRQYRRGETEPLICEQ
ncbi:MAG: hypothetical protein ABDI19_01880 [Armatimonadota bacterium]